MMTQTITLELTDDLIARVREQAAHTDQALEQVLVQQLEVAFAAPLPTLAPNEQAELDALEQLSTNALWTIAQEQMPHDQQNRMEALMNGNTKGKLLPNESTELENLVEQGQRLMLRKAKAAAILTEQGYRVTPDDMTA